MEISKDNYWTLKFHANQFNCGYLLKQWTKDPSYTQFFYHPACQVRGNSFPSHDLLQGRSRLGRLCIQPYQSPSSKDFRQQETGQHDLGYQNLNNHDYDYQQESGNHNLGYHELNHQHENQGPTFFLMHMNHIDALDAKCVCQNCDRKIFQFLTTDLRMLEDLFSHRKKRLLIGQINRYQQCQFVWTDRFYEMKCFGSAEEGGGANFSLFLWFFTIVIFNDTVV